MSGYVVRKTLLAAAGFEDGRGPGAKEHRRPLETGKASGWILPRASRGNTALSTT